MHIDKQTGWGIGRSLGHNGIINCVDHEIALIINVIQSKFGVIQAVQIMYSCQLNRKSH